MKLKYLVTFSFLFVGTVITSMAQRPGGRARMSPEQSLAQANSQMDSVVTLSSDQKTAVNFLHEELFLKDVPERGAFREMTPDQREDFMLKRREKMEAYREGLSAVLTEEQMKLWKSFEETKRGGGPRDRRNSSRGRGKRGQ